jgi:hypothetical protein
MPAKILPLGDSLTVGLEGSASGYRTYRGTLQTLLTGNGVAFDFVGPESSQPAAGGTDPHHAAWGGASIDSGSNNLADRVASIKTTVGAVDLIILYIGWNDVYNFPTNIGTRFTSFVNGTLMTGVWAGSKLLACTLAPEPGKTEAQTASTYLSYATLNAAVRAIANGSTRFVADLAALSGASASSFLETALYDAENAPDVTTVLGGGTAFNPNGGWQVTSFSAIAGYNGQWRRNTDPRAGANGNNDDMDYSVESVSNGTNRFTTSVSAIVPWLWIWCAPGHSSSNTCVEARNGFAQAKRIGAGWEFFFQGARFGTDDRYESVPRFQQRNGNPLFGFRSDGITSWYRPDGNVGIEIWPYDTSPSRGITNFYGAWNRSLMAAAECFMVGCQTRLALINPQGVDDRAQSRFFLKVGADFFSPLGGKRYDMWGWPYSALDGGSDRWKYLRSNDWTQVTSLSIGRNTPTWGPKTADEHWEDPGLQPPAANWSPATPFNNIPQYSLSIPQVRAAPPRIPDYWAAGEAGGSGSGYAEVDYWFNPGAGFRDIHMMQSGADKVAGVMSRAIMSNSILAAFTSGSGGGGGGGGGAIVFEPMLGLATKPNVFLTVESGKRNVAPKDWGQAGLAPVWQPLGTVIVTVGAPLIQSVSAGGVPTPTYSILSGAPSWLSVNSTTGALVIGASADTGYLPHNLIRNSAAAGLVAGSPGTLPTNWSIQGGTAGNFLTRTLAAVTVDGRPGLSIRYAGTLASQNAVGVMIDTGIVVGPGQQVSYAITHRLAAGSATPMLSRLVFVFFRDSSGGAISSLPGTNHARPTADPVRIGGSTTTPAGTATMWIMLYWDLAAGAIDFTVEMAAPQVNGGPTLLEYVPTTGAAAGPTTLGVTNPALAGTIYNLVLRATNTEGTSDLSTQLRVLSAPLVTTTTLPPAVTGQPYNVLLLADGAGPLVWSVESGTLPAGIALAGSTITGTATGTTQTFTLRVTGAAGFALQTYTLTVVAAGDFPIITTTSLASGTVGTAYSQTVTATGAAPITFGASGLPAGLALNSSTGAITGTPTAAGLYIVTVSASNANPPAAAVSFPLRIEAVAAVEVASPWARFTRP